MKRTILYSAWVCVISIGFAGCSRTQAEEKTLAEASTLTATVEPDFDPNNFKVDRPEQFPLVTAGERKASAELDVTGVVSPDVTRQVAVPSLVSGKVLEIDAKVGDDVKKGQLLFKVRSSDVAGALSDYRKAVKNEELAEKNEQLTKIQLERVRLLYEKGANPKSALEIAVNNEDANITAVENAKVDLATTTEHLHLLETDADHSTGVVDVVAPIAGVIGDEQATAGAGVQALNLPSPFTIWDTSHVWILCDVYENDIAKVELGQYVDIRLNAYPDRVFKARISNIASTLDPNLRTAKVRLDMDNPGILRFGMFVTATFHGQKSEMRAIVPATAILHLHDREWVYTPASNGAFRRLEVVSGKTLPDNMQEIVSGIKPGDQVVSAALVLQDTAEK